MDKEIKKIRKLIKGVSHLDKMTYLPDAMEWWIEVRRLWRQGHTEVVWLYDGVPKRIDATTVSRLMDEVI